MVYLASTTNFSTASLCEKRSDIKNNGNVISCNDISYMFALVALYIAVITALVCSVVLINKTNTNLEKGYWFLVLAVCVVLTPILLVLVEFNLFISCFIAVVLLAFVREATKYMFASKNGAIILGVYFALWLAIPYGVYSVFI